MPRGTIFGGPLAPPFSAATCPGIEGALAAAVRAPAAVPLASRAVNDRLADAQLLLPANCSLRWLPPSEACSLMPAVLVLVGDSLSRHLTFALRQVMSGNYAAGALAGTVVPPDSPQDGLFFPRDWYPLCLCDEAYRICAHVQPPPTVQRWASVCPSWASADPSHLPPLHFLQWWGGFWNASHIDELLTAPARGAAHSAGRPRAALVLEVGPAWAEGYTPGSSAILDFLSAGFAAAEGARARVVCYLTLAPHDPQKPPQFLATQGEAPTRTMNAWVARECRARGGVVLDAFALTLGAFTRDGTHYQGQAMSVVAQALLNLLAHFP